jgi:5-(carboxyamino)imidazole ribonucleotide synthase
MPDTLGVVGGGQLGRYFVLAARRLGFRTMVLEPDPRSPAGQVAHEHIVADYDDAQALQRMAEVCRAVTVEFENPPVASLEWLAQRVVVRPAPHAVAITQDRRREKQLCADIGIATAPWVSIESAADVSRVRRDGLAGSAFILKTARLGYDGKGQVRLASLDELPIAWQSLGDVPCVLEGVVPLDMEVSAVLARGADGAVATYALTRNTHVNGILDTSAAPLSATHGDTKLADAISSATTTALRIAEHLHYVGVLAVEFFVSDARLLVNELAPRPHNSGHWTLDAAHTSQFEQQVRALVGLPLGDTRMTCEHVAMGNLLGDRWQFGEPHFALVDGVDGARLHLYGKSEARPGRKMGHLTVLGSNALGSNMLDSNVLTRMRELRDAMTISDESGASR